MKTVITIIAVILFILLAMAGLLCNKINQDHNSKTSVTSDTNTTLRFDSATITIGDSNMNLKPVHDTLYLPVETIKKLAVDTGAIIRQYLSCITSTYSYRKDSQYSLVITDSVCLGKLESRDIEYKNLRPDSIITITNTITKTETITITPKANSLYFGLQTSNMLPVNPGFIYARKRYAFTGNYAPFNKTITAGVYIKIW